MMGLLLWGCGAPAPELMSGTASWSSAFEQLESAGIPIAVQEWTVQGRAVSIAAADTPDGHRTLRLYLEEAPGEPWRGPLAVVLSDRGGQVSLPFTGPTSPRSVPRASLYEARVRVTDPVQLTFEDGPAGGLTFRVPRPGRVDPLSALLPVGLVLLGWVVALVLYRRRGWAASRWAPGR